MRGDPRPRRERSRGLIDHTLIELDGTDNKSRLGANAILAVSCAVAKAAAEEASLPLYRYLGGAAGMQLPVPLMNVINGGAHANNSVDMQEFMIVPIGAPTFREAMRYGAQVFHTLKKLIDKKGMSTTVGDEGGFAPNLPSNEAALQLLMEAIDGAGFTAGTDIVIALDCASSEFYKDGKYRLDAEGLELSSGEFADYLATWVDKYPIVSIEDGMAEGDWDRLEAPDRAPALEGSAGRRRSLRHQHEDPRRRHSPSGIANSILIKINQIGTLTETFAAIDDGERARVYVGDLAPLGRDRGYDHRRHRRRQQRGQIKTGRCRAPTGSPSTTSCCASRKTWADAATYPGRDAFFNTR
jgi:enolase